MAQARRPACATVGVAVVALPAEIDMTNAGRVGAGLRAAFAPGVTTVIADMTATTFCDSAGVRALVLARDRAAASGAELRVVMPSGHVLRVLALLGVDCLLAIYPSLREAVESDPDREVTR